MWCFSGYRHFLVVILSEYLSIAHWVGFILVFLPIYFYRQRSKISELENNTEWKKH